MIQEFVDRFMAGREKLEAQFALAHPSTYLEIVQNVVSLLRRENEYDSPDPERVTEISHGGYQGTNLYVIASGGYDPDKWWYTTNYYGSCSGCDTLESIRSYESTPPTPEQIKDYMTLALQLVQRMRVLPVNGGDE